MRNEALRTLFIYNGIFVFASGLLGPLYAVFVQTFDNKTTTVTLSWAVFLASTTIFTFLVSKYGDKVLEKEYLLVTGYLIRAIVWFAFPFIETIFALFFLQLLLGLGEALGTPSYDAIFAQHLNKNKEIQDYSQWKLVANLLGAAAVIVGGVIVQELSFKYLFFLMGILALVSAVGVIIKPRKLL